MIKPVISRSLLHVNVAYLESDQGKHFIVLYEFLTTTTFCIL